MSVAVEKTAVTPEELLAMPDSVGFELVDGDLKERHLSALSSWVGGQVFLKLSMHIEANHLGWVFPADSGFQCFPNSAKNVRKPDVSFVKLERLKAEEIRDGWLKVVPDLVVEVVSPNDLYYEVEEKVAAYLQLGVPLIWIISPPTQLVRVVRQDGTTTEFRGAGELSGEVVIPGFRCLVTDLFLPKSVETAPEAMG